MVFNRPNGNRDIYKEEYLCFWSQLNDTPMQRQRTEIPS